MLIGRLRAKIERNPKAQELIVTVQGVGYVFLGEIGPPAADRAGIRRAPRPPCAIASPQPDAGG